MMAALGRPLPNDRCDEKSIRCGIAGTGSTQSCSWLSFSAAGRVWPIFAVSADTTDRT